MTTGIVGPAPLLSSLMSFVAAGSVMAGQLEVLPGDLLAALSSAQGGDTIVLADGYYGTLNVTGLSYSSRVTVVSENPLGAVFGGVSISNSDYLRIDGVHVDNQSNGNSGSKVVSVTGSSNIEFLNSEVNGKVDGTYNGHYGLYTSGSSNITFAGNYIHDVKNGGVFESTTDLTVSGNTYDYLGNDSMKFIGVHEVLIEGNFGARNIYPEAGAHLDFIQFQGADSSDITIRGNISLPGTQSNVQGIFLDDAHYTNLLVENNVIVTGMGRGISVSSATNAVATYNTVINLAGEGSKATKILGFATSEQNIMTSYLADSGYVHGNNLSLQNVDPSKPYYFGDYFANPEAGRWLSLEDLLPTPGTVAETIGAPSTAREKLRR